MKGQGTGLWLLAVSLIAVFMLATMAAPALLNSHSGDPGGTSDNNNTTKGLTFQAPSIQTGTSSMDQDESTDLTLRTIITSPTTGEGGTFVWVLSVDGANGQGSAVQARYGDQMVQWFAGNGGALVGIGPRFNQGPGAAPVEVSTSFNITVLTVGSYSITGWVAVAGPASSLDPSQLEACSPVSSTNIQVNEKLKPGVSVNQTLSGPTTTKEDRTVEFTLSSEGAAEGKWNGALIDHILIKKSKIATSDIRVKVNGGTIVLKDNGDSLEADLQTVRPFKGIEKTETASWSLTIQIEFFTPGTYVVECSCLDSVSKKVLSTTDGHSIEVTKSIISLPFPSTSTPNSTPSNGATSNSSTTATAPTTTPPLDSPPTTIPTNSSSASDEKTKK